MLKQEYKEISMAWSVLKYLHDKLFSADPYNFPFNPQTPFENNHYWIRIPTGEFLRPMFAFEELSGFPVGRVGGLKIQSHYQLVIAALPYNADSTDANADALLVIWKVKIIELLHGKRIPFYDFQNLASPVRVESYDFSLEYQRHERQSEKSDQDKNVLAIEFK